MPHLPSLPQAITKPFAATTRWLKDYIWLLIPGAVFALFASSYAILYLPITKINFDLTTAQPCQHRLTFLPYQHQSVSATTGLAIDYQQIAEIGGHALWSSQSCLVVAQLPQSGQYKLQQALFGSGLMSQSYEVAIAESPSLNTDPLAKPVSVHKPLLLSMSGPDQVQEYSLQVDSQTTTCQAQETVLNCDLMSLELKQGQQYPLQINRHYADHRQTVATTTIETLSATTITGGSIAPDTKIYQQPDSLTLEADKTLVAATAVLFLVDDQQIIATTTQLDDRTITVHWTDKLPRDKKFQLVVEQLEAKDGSTLEDPYRLSFSTSAGPRLTNISIPRAGVALNASVTIYFDQPLQDSPQLRQMVTLNDRPVAVQYNHNRLTFTLPSLPKCAEFIIAMKGDLLSNYQVPSTVDWRYNARTICHTKEVIGYSVQSRAIVAYRFGSGPTTILYTAAIHGNEVGTKYLMDQWINELEAKADSLPDGRTIVVVPLLNPDGFAAGTRNNAHNVDLNRNFATADWQRDITDTNRRPIPNGGGTEPMSEPETQAIANYTTKLKPRTTMSFHNVGGLSIANQAAHSNTLAQIYSQMTGYRNATGQSSTTFDYAISGTYDDWIAEKLGLASVLIEMSSRTSPEFARNIDALWRVARY